MSRALVAAPAFRISIVLALIAALAVTAGSVFRASGQEADETIYACLFGGSLSQVNTNAPPANCGRGVNVQWSGAETIDLAASATTVERSGDPVEISGTGSNTATADCLEGEVATGGGHTIANVFGNGAYVDTSRAISDLDDVAVGWTVTATGTSQFNLVNLTAYVICLTVDLEEAAVPDPT